MTGISKQPRIAWVGFHQEGLPAFQALVEAGNAPVCVVTLTEEALARRSGAVDYWKIAAGYGIPCRRVDRINTEETAAWLESFEPDLLVVLGWSQIISPRILGIPASGAIGAHASLLPELRGSAPINWAIIRGMKRTGNTLIQLTEHVDDGDILAQREFPIHEDDTCATLYEKVALTNREMLMEVLALWDGGQLEGRPQPETTEPLLPRRRPSDGLIEWSDSSESIYNFVRALTHPYPGAFTWLGGRKLLVWAAAKSPGNSANGRPGEVIGSVEVDGVLCPLVACGQGVLLLTSVEYDDDGDILRQDAPVFPVGTRFSEEG